MSVMWGFPPKTYAGMEKTAQVALMGYPKVAQVAPRGTSTPPCVCPMGTEGAQMAR